MSNATTVDCETMFTTVAPLYSPTQDSDGNLFAVSNNGDVY